MKKDAVKKGLEIVLDKASQFFHTQFADTLSARAVVMSFLRHLAPVDAYDVALEVLKQRTLTRAWSSVRFLGPTRSIQFATLSIQCLLLLDEMRDVLRTSFDKDALRDALILKHAADFLRMSLAQLDKHVIETAANELDVKPVQLESIVSGRRTSRIDGQPLEEEIPAPLNVDDVAQAVGNPWKGRA